MVLEAQLYHSDGGLGSHWRQKKNLLGERLRSAARQWRSPMRALAVTLGFSASAFMSPAMAQFSCDKVYASERDGIVYSVGEDGSLTREMDLNLLFSNGFGLSPDGRTGYLIMQQTSSIDPTSLGGQVVVFNTLTGQQIRRTSPAIAQTGLTGYVAGAVNPVNGWYYAASGNTEGDKWFLYGYNPSSNSSPPVYVGTITGTTGNNGDLAFDSMGNLFLLAGNINNPEPNNHIYRVGQVPTQASSATLAATAIAVVNGSPASNPLGIAFNTAGQLVVSSSSGWIQWFNPLTGAQIRTADSGYGSVNDLASCAGGNTITVSKELPHGRFAATDQFRLQLSGAGLESTQNADTTGSATGLQSQMIGPLLVVDGAQLSINEAELNTTDFGNYSRNWQCVDEANGNAPVGAGTTFPGSVTIPSGSNALGTSVVCTITNRLLPEVLLSKSSLPASGIAVETGDILTYTIAVEVLNGPTQSDVELTDTLGAGLSANNDATFNGPFTAGPTAGTYILPAGTESGQYSIEYTATVAVGASGVVNNAVEGTGGGNPNDPVPSNPICEPNACETEHPLRFAVVLSKSAEPAAGTKVQAGQILTYTLNVDVVFSATQSDVVITDQLGPGLTYLGVVGDISPFIEDAPGVFRLPAGAENAEYSLSYTARVEETAVLAVNNSVSGQGGGDPTDPPGEAECAPGTCETEHLLEPEVVLSKTATPAAGTYIKAGDTLSYTLNVEVSKGPTQSDVVLTDQLDADLAFGTVTSNPGGFVHDPASNTFTLPAGAADGVHSVVYTVTVDEDSSISVNNTVTGTGGGYPNDPDPSPPSCAPGACETVHPVAPTVLLSKDADPDSGTAVEPGDTLTYHITVEVLNGPTQSDVELTDTLGGGLSFEGVEGDTSPFVPGSTVGTYILPAQTPTGTYTMSYTATVAENATTAVSNSVEGTGGGYPSDPDDPGPICDPGPCATEHPIKFAVQLSKDSNPAPGTHVKQGDELIYTVTVDVVFSATQSDVVITDELGPGLTYGGVVGDISPFVEGPEGTFTLPSGTPNADYSFSYKATVNQDATVEVSNQISGIGGGTPGDPTYPGPSCDFEEDLSCSTVHPVEPTVLLSKTANPESGTQVNPGDTLTYTLQVVVESGPTQSRVMLEDVLGQGLSFTGVVQPITPFEYDQESGAYYLPAGTPNGTYTASYTAEVNESATTSVNNRVAGSGGGDPDDPTPSNPICAPGACETEHPLVPPVPPVVLPVPLDSLPWNALLVLLLGGLAMWLGGRRPIH